MTAVNKFRSEVLKTFKKLHKARKDVFKDDTFALQATRKKINQEFKSKMDVADPIAVQELIQYSNDVAIVLRTTIVQARQVNSGTYELQITPDTAKMINVPFKDCPSKE